MNDKSGGEDGKRKGGGGPRGGGGGFKGRTGGAGRTGDGDRPRAPGSKPYRPREDRPRGAKPQTARSQGEGAGERKPFRADRPERPEAADRGERKPFTPRSRGMVSHGGREPDGTPKRPRSYGRIGAEDSAASAGDRRPKSFSDRPRGESRAPRSGGSREAGAREPAGAGAATMRIAKRLARAGIASRRDAEGMIADGRVRLNGRVLDTPAIDVGPNDRIEIDGAPLPAIERTRLWLFHKPAGLVTTNRDPEGRATVFDRLPEDMPRVLSIGRLDINTEGLLLLTNDGGLARTLELPATGWLRRYRVRAHGRITQAQLDELRQGVAVEGVFYGAIEASLDKEQGSNVWLTLGLREGKNREVKRVLAHLGLEVNRLIRLSFGPFQLGELGEGEVQEIRGRTLRDQLGERLIEESGADFDAPIVNAFSNKPVAAEPRSEERPTRKDTGSEWISASDGGRPNRKKFGAAKREDALGRLETRAPRGERPERGDRSDRGPRPERGARPDRAAKPFGERKTGRSDDKRAGGDDRDAHPAKRPAHAPKRTANVWMAPGARAIGDKKKAEREARDRLNAEGAVSRGPRAGAGGPRKPRPQGEGGSPRSAPRGAPRGAPGTGPRGPRRSRDDD